MDLVMNNFGKIVLYLGMFDTAMILMVGVVAAVLYLFKVEPEFFYERVLPAVGIIVGTTIAAGIVMAVTKWIVERLAGGA